MSLAAPGHEDTEGEALRRAQRAHEPSMEEILASIRAIIADDREPSPPKPGPQIVVSNPTVAVARAPNAEEISRPQAAAAEPARVEPSPAAAPTVVWSRPTAAKPGLDAEPQPPAPSEEDEPLVSDVTETAVAASFKALSESMTARGLEIAAETAREMIRPMIKAWLDENLPTMVERLVRAEIQRVARGGG